MSDAAAAYNTPDFAVRIPDDLTALGKSLPVPVGAPAPEFEVARLDGGTFRLADARGQRHVVFMTGAITSPMAAINVPALNALSRQYRERSVDFYLLYVKESHPAEKYRHHTSFEQKLSHARAFRDLEKPEFPVLVDHLDGSTHRAYGPWPAALFVVHKNGLLVFRSSIANAAQQLALYLEQLANWDHIDATAGERVPHIGYTEMLVELDADEGEHFRVYDRAGPKAFEDYWQFYPGHRDVWPLSPERKQP